MMQHCRILADMKILHGKRITLTTCKDSSPRIWATMHIFHSWNCRAQHFFKQGLQSRKTCHN